MLEWYLTIDNDVFIALLEELKPYKEIVVHLNDTYDEARRQKEESKKKGSFSSLKLKFMIACQQDLKVWFTLKNRIKCS